MSFAQRFIGAEILPSRMSELDVQQFFSLSKRPPGYPSGSTTYSSIA